MNSHPARTKLMSSRPVSDPSRQARGPGAPEPPDSQVAVEELPPWELIWSVVQELLRIFVPAAVVALLIHQFLAETTVVFGESMEPLLYHHQRLVVEKVSYRFVDPEHGDIVVVEAPDMNANLIKRVIGLPGDEVAIMDGVVYLNGRPLQEPYVQNAQPDDEQPLVLDRNQYYIMGDNRANSRDSRNFGPIQTEEIVGRAWLRYWPLTDIRLFPY